MAVAALWLAALLALTAPAVAQNNASDAGRLIEALQLAAGSHVAEIGAGRGALTIAMAKHVGPSGRVYSSELGETRIHELREAVEKAEATNVTIVDGHPIGTNLPETCCDAIFMRDVYHHFDDPAAMNASIFRALKPGGRLAIIDFPPRKSESATPDARDSRVQHGVTPDTLAEELKKAGFEPVSVDNLAGRREFIVVVRKPGAP